MQLSVRSQPRKRTASLSLLIALVGSLLPALSLSTPLLAHNIGALAHSFKGSHVQAWTDAAPPTYAACQARGFLCYDPQAIRNVYNLSGLIDHGITGKGETIAIIDSFGSPTGFQDLQQFDKDYNLPDPPSFQQIAPLGSLPFDPKNSDMVGWAEETSLDIQWAHAMAPGANIVVLTSPVSETQGVQGMPEFLALEKYGIDHHYKIFSQSWSTTENTLFTPEGKKVLNDFNDFYKKSVSYHEATFFASSGDSGSANVDVAGNTYPFPTVGYPASDPWVTSVGGTTLTADANGKSAVETVWNDGIGSATGGGISQYFKQPDYQERNLTEADQALLKGYRGLPDISSNADPATGVPVYLGFLPTPRYYVFGGTSESSPVWAGIFADASQYAHRPITNLNDKLYRIGHEPCLSSKVFHDVTTGNNAQAPIPGYSATAGWDAVTGWGTPNAEELFKALTNR